MEKDFASFGDRVVGSCRDLLAAIKRHATWLLDNKERLAETSKSREKQHAETVNIESPIEHDALHALRVERRKLFCRRRALWKARHKTSLAVGLRHRNNPRNSRRLQLSDGIESEIWNHFQNLVKLKEGTVEELEALRNAVKEQQKEIDRAEAEQKRVAEFIASVEKNKDEVLNIPNFIGFEEVEKWKVRCQWYILHRLNIARDAKRKAQTRVREYGIESDSWTVNTFIKPRPWKWNHLTPTAIQTFAGRRDTTTMLSRA
ncbi:hypothetical protein EJ08DRAFT_720094 [Tothia fuscella]|uniref:Uncharacterized protein n=1 Tax=Tothia fuscella TaxID=1048955 RepID=A0A9P4NMR7_9PEZI|nr:hypothetical protein EJ08DRAFT_720094 [Tothia fuscella]